MACVKQEFKDRPVIPFEAIKEEWGSAEHVLAWNDLGRPIMLRHDESIIHDGAIYHLFLDYGHGGMYLFCGDTLIEKSGKSKMMANENIVAIDKEYFGMPHSLYIRPSKKNPT